MFRLGLETEVLLEDRGDELVYSQRPGFDAFCAHYLGRHVAMCTVLCLAAVYFVVLRLWEPTQLKGSPFLDSPFTLLGFGVAALWSFQHTYRHVRWLMRGEKVVVTHETLVIERPAFFRARVRIPLADIRSIELRERRFDLSNVFDHWDYRRCAVEVRAGLVIYGFGRALDPEFATEMMRTVRGRVQRELLRAAATD
jgi:hypothetical protein